jgi:large subunit ribosomal protein L4
MAEAKIQKTKVAKVAEVKKETKTKVAKTVEKDVVKAEVAVVKSAKKVEKKESSLTIDVFDLEGKVTGKLSLPVEIFGEKVNKTLLAQAVRVYLANKRQGNASTKTRGEVDGSTRKIYRQKGTGKARHGSIRAPIFVKGGIVFGPRPRDFGLDLPKKMRRKALFSALSSKFADGEIKILSGLEGIEAKTKHFVTTIKNLGFEEKKRKILLVTAKDPENVKRAARNVAGISLTAAKRLNAYDVLATKQLLVTKDAIEEMKESFLAKK